MRVVLRDGTEVRTNDPRARYALAMHEYRLDSETGTATTAERLLSWHSTLAEAERYERMGGETYIVPVETA